MSEQQYDNTNQIPFFDKANALKGYGEIEGSKANGYLIATGDDAPRPSHKLVLEFYDGPKKGTSEIVPLWRSKKNPKNIGNFNKETGEAYDVWVNDPGSKVIAKFKYKPGEHAAVTAAKDDGWVEEPTTRGRAKPDQLYGDNSEIPF